MKTINTSMRYAGELRTLQIGSPNRSVYRDSSPLGPTSQLLSTCSTLSLSILGSYSLIITTLLLFSAIFIKTCNKLDI
ncbi:hypothetical protein HanPSC8_Chr12g0531631 [Helianthus annuus]|nr:hypothetical protein HanPSC8_Chr12g0531631 [Helianthus annuus]